MPSGLFLLQFLWLFGSLLFHTNVRIICYIFVKKYHCTDFTELVLCFEWSDILILIISIPKHRLSVSIFSFINVLHISVYKSFASLVKFIPRHFILFDAMVIGIAFLISLSGSLLL